MLIRPVKKDDLDIVLTLAEAAGFGMTSLPADHEVLAEKLDKAIASFEGKQAGQETFFFVMEDITGGEIVGTTGIKAHVGLNQPFYSYKLTTISQQCKELDHFSTHRMLQVTNDLTGCSEIGSLFLLPHYRRDRLGRLLSLCRFLFIAAHDALFADKIIAEMRGVSDMQGRSPFYDSIAHPFFDMEFREADYLNATQGNQFIADLMPKYPIYVELLPKAAQDVISQPHPNSVPARAMLEREGFRWNGYVDIFDGGPTLEADKALLKTANDSVTATITEIGDVQDQTKYMLANDRLAEFRCCAGRMKQLEDGQIMISDKAADLLGLAVGDRLRYASYQS